MKWKNCHPGLGITILIAVLILVCGTAFNLLYLTLFSSPTQKTTRLDAASLQTQAYIYTPSDDYAPYPWDSINPKNHAGLSDEERTFLYEQKVPHFIANLLVDPIFHDMEKDYASDGTEWIQNILNEFRHVDFTDNNGTRREFYMIDSSSLSMNKPNILRAAVTTDGQIFSLYRYKTNVLFDEGAGQLWNRSQIVSYVNPLVQLAKDYNQKLIVNAFAGLMDNGSDFAESTTIQLGNRQLLVSVGSAAGLRRFLIFDQTFSRFWGFHLQN